jgi:hypothetical protein
MPNLIKVVCNILGTGEELGWPGKGSILLPALRNPAGSRPVRPIEKRLRRKQDRKTFPDHKRFFVIVIDILEEEKPEPNLRQES